MLKGKKTFIRAVEFEDARLISVWLNDRETNRHLEVIYPLSKRYADAYVSESESDPNKKMFLIDNEDRKTIGMVVINDIKWEYRNCEIGIAIYDKNSRGKGYGKDAIETLINFIFNDMNINLIHLRVSEENEEAIGLYKSLGFEIEGVLRQRFYKDGKYGNLISMSKLKDRG